jgi:hypothetical protein
MRSTEERSAESRRFRLSEPLRERRQRRMLIASGQVQAGDLLLVDCDRQLRSLVFLKESKALQAGSPAGKSAAA